VPCASGEVFLWQAKRHAADFVVRFHELDELQQKHSSPEPIDRILKFAQIPSRFEE
jgi:hypothetical protein